MDTNNWRPAPGGGEPTMDTGDWRSQLQQDSRQRIVNKKMETLKRHLPFSGQEGLQELMKIAVSLEEKIYTSATSQPDYLRKISLEMLTMETNSQNTMANSLPSNSGSNSKNPPGPLGMQTQIATQGQSLPIPMAANHGQARQQPLSQNIQNNIAATAVQGSVSLASALPPVGGLPSTTVPHVGQNSNLQNIQNISGISQNSVGNSMGQGVSSSVFANTQRQMPASLDSTAQTGNANSGDWQEEIYQKIKSMKEAYLPDLNEMYQKIAGKLQQHDSLPQQPKNEQLEKLKMFKTMLEKILAFLQVHKSAILPNFKDKMGSYEKQILNLLHSNRPRRPGPSLQPGQQLLPPHMPSMQQSQQTQSQITQAHSHENRMNPQLESMNLQSTAATMQQNNVTTSLDSTAQTGNANSGDWQEEIYQKVPTQEHEVECMTCMQSLLKAYTESYLSSWEILFG